MPVAEPIDFVEELRLRRWARMNWVAAEQRDDSWHPVVHEEMDRRDQEQVEPIEAVLASHRLVPLEHKPVTHGPHEIRGRHNLAALPTGELFYS